MPAFVIAQPLNDAEPPDAVAVSPPEHVRMPAAGLVPMASVTCVELSEGTRFPFASKPRTTTGKEPVPAAAMFALAGGCVAKVSREGSGSPDYLKTSMS